MHIYKCLCYELCKSEDELPTLCTYSWEGKHLGRNSEGEEEGWWEAWMQIRSEDVTLLKLTTIHHTRVHRFLHITSTSSSHFALKTWWVIQMCRARQSVWSQTSNCLKLTYPWYLNFLVVILTLMVKFKMTLVSVCEAGHKIQAEVKSRFWSWSLLENNAEVQSKLRSWSLVEILKLKCILTNTNNCKNENENKHCQRQNGPKALSTLTESTRMGRSRSFIWAIFEPFPLLFQLSRS